MRHLKLNWFKKVSVKVIMLRIILLFILLGPSQLFALSFFSEADQFFRIYVNGGLVKYDELSKNPAALNKLVKRIDEYPLAMATDPEKKAFYINAYNILVIHHVIRNYPTEGPLKIKGFFDQLKAGVAGELLTLDQLEKERLYKAFPDERLHFVLVCAALGCPPLANYAFMPEELEKQLADRTTYVLNFPTFIRVNKNTVQVSKIFEWYEGDFLTESKSTLNYIDQYHTQNLEGKEYSYYEYDWNLNRN